MKHLYFLPELGMKQLKLTNIRYEGSIYAACFTIDLLHYNIQPYFKMYFFQQHNKL